MKIDFLIGDNPYGTTIHFAKGLSSALEAIGIKSRLFWLGGEEFFHAYYEYLRDPPDLTCSFSDISFQGRSIGEFWKIPHLSLLVDPPIYFLHHLQGEYSWVSCVDQKDTSFVRQLGFERTFFLPHAVDAMLKTEINQERCYDVVFFGTCLDYEALEKSLSKQEKELVLAASNHVLSTTGKSVLDALQDLDISEEDLPRYHDLVDQYTRGKDRVELIRSLNGHQVHIWGDGPWKKYLPQAILHPALPFEQTWQIMQKSQIVLNSCPRFKAGAHERIFYALMCGAGVYTGENTFLTDALPELFTYRFGEWENPSFSEWKERAAIGQRRVLAEHTYHKRAHALLIHLCSEKHIGDKW